jgi:hypothetical protein
MQDLAAVGPLQGTRFGEGVGEKAVRLDAAEGGQRAKRRFVAVDDVRKAEWEIGPEQPRPNAVPRREPRQIARRHLVGMEGHRETEFPDDVSDLRGSAKSGLGLRAPAVSMVEHATELTVISMQGRRLAWNAVG